MHNVCLCVHCLIVVRLPKGECWNVCVVHRAFLFEHSTWHDVIRQIGIS